MIDLIGRYRWTFLWAAWIAYCAAVFRIVEAIRP